MLLSARRVAVLEVAQKNDYGAGGNEANKARLRSANSWGETWAGSNTTW
jgi:hypothetical protein